MLRLSISMQTRVWNEDEMLLSFLCASGRQPGPTVIDSWPWDASNSLNCALFQQTHLIMGCRGLC